MEITKLSTKGQIVIPEKMRKNFEVGTPFTVTRKDNLIILKSVEGLTEKEKKELEEINEIWKDIDAGKCETYSVKEFFAKMKEW
jgi:bifunctional DNA-binding transcriptional regulator/antitoxin component of YhaV-PrlF toxin-antitoxin module